MTYQYRRQDPPYDPATGMRRPSHPGPPLPPKEVGFDQRYVTSPTKETQYGVAELEGDSGIAELEGYEAPSPTAVGKGVKFKSQPGQKRRREVRILSLDGGGIRGFSTLLILQELMYRIYVLTHGGKPPPNASSIPRPCDYFDLIGGTGTGGLIALMLGRMRMSVERAKEYYVELTRYVFITDKTLMGVPYGKTLFKAGRLQEAIKHCVRESTKDELPKLLPPPGSPPMPIRTPSWSSRRRASSAGHIPHRHTTAPKPGQGDPDAPLLDTRHNRCRTFVTAVYQGTPPTGAQNPPALLRTYPSPAESTPSYACTIWQAGRATSATLAAFKPITIGTSTFLDEGSGKYNPALTVLAEARENEFPDDTIGVFVSIGTGKSAELGGGDGGGHDGMSGRRSFVPEHYLAAQRRMHEKLVGCETVHQLLIEGEGGGRPALAKAGVAREDYYRFNVEVGVGEFALNEWNRLPEVGTGTRRYLSEKEVAAAVKECAAKMVDIERRRRMPPKPAAVGRGQEGGRVVERVVMPDHRHHLPLGSPVRLEEHPYFRVPASPPIIRITSPSTVAGGSDDEEESEGRRRAW